MAGYSAEASGETSVRKHLLRPSTANPRNAMAKPWYDRSEWRKRSAETGSVMYAVVTIMDRLEARLYIKHCFNEPCRVNERLLPGASAIGGNKSIGE